MKLLKFSWFLTCVGKDAYGYDNWETNQRIFWIYKFYLKIGLYFKNNKLMCNENE